MVLVLKFEMQVEVATTNSKLAEANNWYRRSQTSDGLSRVLRESYLRHALRIYHEEIKNVASHEGRVSLMRNLGMTNLRLAEVLDGRQSLDILLFHLAEAVEKFCSALILKRVLGPVEPAWLEKIMESISDSFYLAFRSVDGDVKTRRIPKFPFLQKIFNAIGTEKEFDPVRVQFLIARGRFFLCCGVTAMDKNDFKSTLQVVEYGREDMEMALQFNNGNEDGLEDIKDLQNDHTLLRQSCESIRMRAQADNLYVTYVNQLEHVNFFDIMWDILDMYKDAAIKTRERDFENEALALSRQGRMFEEIFKIRHKAHQYYRRAFDLALILPPRNLNKVDWFLESKQALDRFQQDILKEEEEKAKKEKGPILEKLAPVLKEIKAADEKSMYNLLAHIYTKHPPKVQHDYVEKDVNSENIKRTIMKAIRNYHPDKQMLFGMEWRVLCEEITKCLTVRYETIKGSELLGET